MNFCPIPFRTLDNLRRERPYINKDDWFGHLKFLSNTLIEAWAQFKLDNPQHWDLFVLAENRIGAAPTRIDIAVANLYPIEEHYYNEIYAFYYRLYEIYKGFSDKGVHTTVDKFKSRLENFYMGNHEIKACIAYILKDSTCNNTLLALKAINRFAKHHGIRFEDVETVFKEWVL